MGAVRWQNIQKACRFGRCGGTGYCHGDFFRFGGRRRKKFVVVENVRLLVKLFMCCVGVGKKSLFERPNFGVGQSILRVLGAWSGH